MLRHIAWFETRYWLRSWMLWIFLALVSALVLQTSARVTFWLWTTVTTTLPITSRTPMPG